MNFKLKCFLPLVLCFTLFLGSSCFASSGRGINANLYSDSVLNSQVIREFNNFSASEQERLLRDLFPLISLRLGFKATDAYTQLNGAYVLKLHNKQNLFDSADDYFNNSNDSSNEKYYFVYYDDGSYHWYSQLSQYLINVVSVNNDNLVVNDTSGMNFIINDYVNNYASSRGVINLEILSFRNINSSTFFTLDKYNSFITLCQNMKAQGYNFVEVYNVSSSTGGMTYFREYCQFACNFYKGNLYINGVYSDGSRLKLCNNSGVALTFPGVAYVLRSGSNTWVTADSIHGTYMFKGSSSPSARANSGTGSPGGWLYTLNDDVTSYDLYTSLQAWIDNHGHFELPFEVTNYVGTVPSTVISSNDMTNIYTSNYTDNSVNNNSTVNNIYYPSDYVPDSNSYDSESHILDFSGVGALISSIGNLIGSLINGIANGIANILNAISTSARNLIENLSGGIIFEFLRAFLDWLPEPIPSLLYGLFTLSVTFAVIRLVKGAFS